MPSPVETSQVLNENLGEATGTAGRLSRRAGPANRHRHLEPGTTRGDL